MQRFWTWGDWLRFSLPIVATLLVFGAALAILPAPEDGAHASLQRSAPETLTAAQTSSGMEDPPLVRAVTRPVSTATAPLGPSRGADSATPAPAPADEDPRDRMARLARFAPVNILATSDRGPSSALFQAAPAAVPPPPSVPDPGVSPPAPRWVPPPAEPEAQAEAFPEAAASPPPDEGNQQLGTAGATSQDD